MSMQKVALKIFRDRFSRELTELEEQKTKEALEPLRRKHKLVKLENERERARMIQGMELSGGVPLRAYQLPDRKVFSELISYQLQYRICRF